MNHVQAFLKEEDGIETVELALIAIALVALASIFGTKMTGIVNNIFDSNLKDKATNFKVN